jgi:tetratricopeptide (TPR) repeat protein
MGFSYGEYDGEEEVEPTLNELWAQTTPSNHLETRTAALVKIAVRLANSSDHYGAISAAQAAGELFEQLGDQGEVAQSHYFSGEQFMRLKKYAEARDEFIMAADAFHLAIDDFGRGESLRMLGYAFKNLDDFPAALEAWHDAVRILEASFSYSAAGAITLEIGQRQLENNHYELAMETFGKAMDSFQLCDDLIGAGRTHVYMAQCLQNLGKAKEALPRLRDAVRIYEYLEDSHRLADARMQLARGLQLAGQLDESESIFNLASEAFKTFGSHKATATTYVHLSEIERSRGNTKRAEELVTLARTIYDSCGYPFLVLGLDVANAVRLLESGNELAAEEILSKALSEFDENTNEKTEREVRTHLSLIYQAWGQYERALHLIENYQQRSKQWAFIEKLRWQNAQASALIGLGRISDARPILEKAIAIDLVEMAPGETARSYELLAMTMDEAQATELTLIRANSVALYLKAGQVAEATRVSGVLLPDGPQNALKAVREADGQLAFLFDATALAGE